MHPKAEKPNQVPYELTAMTPETLTFPVIEKLLLMVKCGYYAWVDIGTMDGQCELLSQGRNMRTLLEYAIPCRRDQLIAMWSYGLAGTRLTASEIVRALSLDQSMITDMKTVRKVLAHNSQRLTIALGVTSQDLTVYSGDCLSTLNLGPVVSQQFFEQDIRLISQLVTWSADELARTFQLDGFQLAIIRVALLAHPDRLRLYGDTTVI